MTELERLEKDYDEKRYKFEATSVVYGAALDAAWAVREAAIRAEEKARNARRAGMVARRAAMVARAAALALDEARKEQSHD